MHDSLFNDVYGDKSKPVYDKDILSMPVYDEPVYNEDIFLIPVYDKPVYDEDILSMPVYDKPVYDEDIFYNVVDTIRFGVNVVDLGVVGGGTTGNGYMKVIEEELRLESVGSATENGDGIEKDVVTTEIGVDLQNSESIAEEIGVDLQNSESTSSPILLVFTYVFIYCN